MTNPADDKLADGRKRWPSPRRRKADAQKSRPAWIRTLPDESLKLLLAIFDITDGAVPDWAKPLCEHALSADRADGKGCTNSDPQPSGTDAPDPDARDFSAVLRSIWPNASPKLRTALRTIASELGVEAPEEPIPDPAPPDIAPAPEPEPEPRMRRTRFSPRPEPEPKPERQPESDPEWWAEDAPGWEPVGGGGGSFL